MAYPTDRKYTKEHEWIQVAGATATVGITRYAQESLGELAYESGDVDSAKMRFEEASAEGGLECAREELGRTGGRLVADRRYAGEVFTERLDIAVDLHDGSMTSQ